MNKYGVTLDHVVTLDGYRIIPDMPKAYAVSLIRGDQVLHFEEREYLEKGTKKWNPVSPPVNEAGRKIRTGLWSENHTKSAFGVWAYQGIGTRLKRVWFDDMMQRKKKRSTELGLCASLHGSMGQSMPSASTSNRVGTMTSQVMDGLKRGAEWFYPPIYVEVEGGVIKEI